MSRLHLGVTVRWPWLSFGSLGVLKHMKTQFCKTHQAKVFGVIICSWMAILSLFAQTWTQVASPNTNWNYIVCSANGSTLACAPRPMPPLINFSGPGSIYISTNSGTSWTACNVGSPASSTWYWTALYISADGSKLIADSNSAAIYVSTNWGSSWTPSLLPKRSGETLGPLAASADGTQLVAADNFSALYTSTNAGLTWTTNLSPSSSGLTSMACSADGHMLIANYHFNFYLSTNFGASWTNISSRMPPTETRSVGCASAGGSTCAILADAGIVISTNSGMTWSLNYYDGNPIYTKSIACSADGTKFIASQENDYPGGIYLSTNSGSSWQFFTNSGSAIYSVAASADGCQLAASTTNGIYLIQFTPSPWLNTLLLPGSLTLTWTVPSTNFVLQQSSDLVSWMDVTNIPTLDSSLLQNQATLLLTGSNNFYRLAAP
ncbi:MAG: WD40/YVTN/BNR-like repeat-containing protein [Limisphaerales bacterium]